MATSYTSLLGLALPVTGELSGTWGDTVNNYITNYLDAAVAGVQIISGSQTAVTLSVTNGSSLVQVGAGATGSAQYGIIRCSGNPASLLTITAPAASKSYLIINATSTSQSVKIVGTGPTTGVTLVSGESAVVAWNGTDFIKVSSSAVDGVSTFSAGTTGFTPSTATSGAVTLAGTLATTNGGTGLTSFTANRVFYSSSTSAIGQSANLTFDGTTLTANALTTTSTVTINGGTANGVAYLNGSKVLTSGSALTFDGTTLKTNSGNNALHLIGDANGPYVSFYNSASRIGYIRVTDGGAFLINPETAGSNIQFRVADNEQMRLTSTGLGIGTSSPSQRLDVRAASAGIYLSSTTGTNQAALQINNSGGDFYFGLENSAGNNFNTGTAYAGVLWRSGANPICFVNNSTERMRLDSSGNLGLGVTPSAWGSGKAIELGQVTGNALWGLGINSLYLTSNARWNGSNYVYTNNGAANLYGAGTGNGTFTWYTAPSGTAGNAISFTQAMTLDASGLLQVGTTSNTGGARVDVVSNATSAYTARSSSSGASTTVKAVRSVDGGATNFANAQYDALSHAWILSNFTQAMTLDASGNLGVGATSPTYKLAVESTGQILLSLNSTNANGGYMAIQKSGIANGYIGAANPLTGGSSTDLAIRAENNLVFATNTSTERARIDSSGNLLVGTTSALTSASGRGNVTINGTDAVLAFGNSNSSAGYVYAASTNLEISAASTRYINFLTNGSERARITSGGFFKASNSGTYAGSTASYHELYSNASGDWIGYFTQATATNPNGVVIQYTAAAPNGTGNTFLYCQDNAAVRATIRSNGGLANYSANNVNLSDRREKTNFAPAKSYLDTICAIPVQTFNYIDQSEDDPGLTLGVVAQDVQAVAPELVMESNWGTEDNPKMRLSVYQTDLQYALMKALQELKSELDSVKAELATLKGA